VLLAGDGFLPGLVVRIEGVEQGPVAVESSTRARFTTLGGSTGESARLELENPDGARAEQAFVYAPQADPVVTAVSPDSGSGDGGTVLTIRGRDFTPTMTAWFYADPAGEAVPAAGTTFVDASTLSVTTPAHAAGPVSLLVADASACGVFAENAFTFSGGSGGGGACARVSVPAPRGPRAWLDGAVWCLAVLGTLCLRARSARGVVAGS
jgi:hypothetical protein